MGLQSTTFYIMVAWLPSIAIEPGYLADLADSIEVGARGDLGDLGRGFTSDVRGQLGQQFVLALDVVVERGTGDAERVGDVLQARPGEATFGEQPDRLLWDLVLDQFPGERSVGPVISYWS